MCYRGVQNHFSRVSSEINILKFCRYLQTNPSVLLTKQKKIPLINNWFTTYVWNFDWLVLTKHFLFHKGLNKRSTDNVACEQSTAVFCSKMVSNDIFCKFAHIHFIIEYGGKNNKISFIGMFSFFLSFFFVSTTFMMFSMNFPLPQEWIEKSDLSLLIMSTRISKT